MPALQPMAPSPNRRMRDIRSRNGSFIAQMIGMGKKRQVKSATTPNIAAGQNALGTVNRKCVLRFCSP